MQRLNIGEKIKYVREQKDISASRLSEHIGHTSPNSILNIESGKVSPHFNRIEDIAEFLDMSALDLIQIEVPAGYFEAEEKTSIIGEKIELALKNLDQSISALAEATGIPERAIKMIISGSSKRLSTENSLKIAKSLQVPLEYLVDNDVPVSD